MCISRQGIGRERGLDECDVERLKCSDGLCRGDDVGPQISNVNRDRDFASSQASGLFCELNDRVRRLLDRLDLDGSEAGFAQLLHHPQLS